MSRDHPVHLDQLALLDPAVLWDLLADLETLDLRDPWERKVHLDLQDHLEYLERMEILAQSVILDRKEILERLVFKDHLVLEELAVLMDQRENLEQLAIQALLVHLVTLV